MTYGVDMPRVDPQLQNDVDGSKPTTGGADCSIKTIQGGVRWATRGVTVPTVKNIRTKIGVPTGGVSMATVLTGYKAYDINAVKLADWAAVVDALKAGKFIHIAINYGWVNTNAPELSGQKNFTGGHGLGVYGYETFPPLTANWTNWLDPLGDGRRAGLAKQLTMARLGQVKGAMEAFTSFGAIAVTAESDDTDQRILNKNAAFDTIILNATAGRAI